MGLLGHWIWVWVVAELVSLLGLCYLHHQGEFFSTALARPPSLPSAGVSSAFLLSCPWDSSPTSMPSEPAPQCCPVKVWAPLAQVLQPVRCWASSPVLIPSGLAHPFLLTRASSTVLPRSAGPALPSAADFKGQQQPTHSHNVRVCFPKCHRC